MLLVTVLFWNPRWRLQKAQSDTAGAKVDRLSRDLELLARLLKDRQVLSQGRPTTQCRQLPVALVRLSCSSRTRVHQHPNQSSIGSGEATGRSVGEPKTGRTQQTRKRQARQFAVHHSSLVWSLHSKGKTHREIQCLERCWYDDP